MTTLDIRVRNKKSNKRIYEKSYQKSENINLWRELQNFKWSLSISKSVKKLYEVTKKIDFLTLKTFGNNEADGFKICLLHSCVIFSLKWPSDLWLIITAVGSEKAKAPSSVKN